MPFRILNCENNEPHCGFSGDILEWETGAEAQACAKLLALHGDTKYRVKKVLNEHWREREQLKFVDGTYADLPWAGMSWWTSSECLALREDHFAHVSVKEPGKIAYTETPAKGMDNIHTRIKPGRYLEKYFSAVMKRWDISPRGLAADFDAMYAPRKVYFAETEDDIQWVYENGPESCMSDKAYRTTRNWGYPTPGKWPLDTHACRVYAAGNLQIAYIVADDENPRAAKCVTARTVVWPARLTHSRVYGDELRLKNLLRAQGYHFEPPFGAKVQRLPVPRTKAFLMPYIDAGHSSGQGSLWVRDAGDHMVICSLEAGAYHSGSVHGLSSVVLDASGNAATPLPCENCGGEGVQRGHVMYLGPTDRHFWCAVCRNNPDFVFIDSYHDALYSRAHMDCVEMADGSFWSSYSFNARGFTCSGNGRRYNRQKGVRLDDGRRYSVEWVQQNAVQCYNDRVWRRRTDCVHNSIGWFAASWLENHKVCAYCGRLDERRPDEAVEWRCDRCNEHLAATARSPLVMPEQALNAMRNELYSRR